MSYVFGPVPSRRLGRSLGVDPMPFKTCDWNCIYCQLGRTRRQTLARREYTPAKDVVSEVREALSRHAEADIDWITFLGAGEPTLHSDLGRMIREVRRLTTLPIAVITNGSLLHLPEVRRDLEIADAVMPTLDAGSEETFHRINRPIFGLSLDQHVEGLVEFRRGFRGSLCVEVMLVQLINDSRAELQGMAAYLERVRPDEVHVGMPSRPTAEAWVSGPARESLDAASEILGATKLPPLAEGTVQLRNDCHILDAILDVIARHPLRDEELRSLLEPLGPVEPVLSQLATSGRAKTVERLHKHFWCRSDAVHACNPAPRHRLLS